MRRPTDEELKTLLAGWTPEALKRRAKERKPKAPTTSEADLQKGCCQLLEHDGWRIVTTDPKWMRGLGVSEKGIADTLAIRYDSIARFKNVANSRRVNAEILWIEWKKIGGKTAQLQHDWHATERMRGALTWKAVEDFEPTIEGFAAHYNASGLAINQMRVGAQRRS